MARHSLLLIGAFVTGAISAVLASSLQLRVGNYYRVSANDSATLNVNLTCVTTTGENITFTGIHYGKYSVFKNVSESANCTSSSCWTISVSSANTTSIIEQEISLLNGSTPSQYTVTVYGVDQADIWVNHSLPNSSPPPIVLGIDQALFTVYNDLPSPLKYSELSSNCYKCKPNPLGTIYPGDVAHIIADTTFPLTYYFNKTMATDEPLAYCSVERLFVEHSVSVLVINKTTLSTVTKVTVLVEGDNAYLPILYAAIVIIGLFAIIYITSVVYRILNRRGMLHWRAVDRAFDKDMGDPKKVYNVNSTEQSPLLNGEGRGMTEEQNNGTGDDNKERKKQRLKSLDTFRGLSLVIMIFVNYGGGGYWFFAHSKWNGITVADLVFPWFIWIMGVSVVFSFRGRKSDSVFSRLYQIIRRSLILMGLGLFLNNGADLSRWRIPGVLQRFAISYFVVAITELITFPVYNKWKIMWRHAYVFRDITSNWIQLSLVLLLEALWLAITFGLPVPDCPTGYLGPGGLGNNGQYVNCTGGAAGYIDRVFFTTDHIYGHPTSKKLYQSCAFDPEGLLGSINSIVICFLGVQAGRIISYHTVHWQRLVRFLIWGVVLSVIATALCEASKNDGLIPLNKNLWSLSFILLMAGTGFLLLAFLYFLIDVLRVWHGAPFVYPGMNSILVYVGSELLEEYFPFSWASRDHSHLEMLSSNLVGVSVWLLLAFYWYWTKFFVKI